MLKLLKQLNYFLVSEKLFDSAGQVSATVPLDVHLDPKTFHIQLCNVTAKDKVI